MEVFADFWGDLRVGEAEEVEDEAEEDGEEKDEKGEKEEEKEDEVEFILAAVESLWVSLERGVVGLSDIVV